MESVETSQPDRLADLQLSVPRFLLYSLLTAGVYYIYRTILIFDRIARSETERTIQRVLIGVSLITIFLPQQLLNRDYLEIGFILREAMYIVWYALMIHAASQLQGKWGYSMDLIWTFLFQSFYLQYKANEKPNGNHQAMNKRLLSVCIVVALFLHLAPPKTTFVSSSEMSPTLIQGDEVRVDELGSDPSLGLKLSDIVVFRDKRANNVSIGRIQGVPRQKIKIASPKGEATEERTLGINQYYIERDNKAVADLLLWGQEPYGIVSDTQIEGRVKRVLWNIEGDSIRWDRFLLRVAP